MKNRHCFAPGSRIVRSARPSFHPLLVVATVAASFVPCPEAAAGTYTWTNSAGGNWSVPGNWNSAPTFDNTAVLDFSTLNITATTTLKMDGVYTANTLKFGDSGTASNNWLLDNNGSGSNVLTLDGSSPTIFVNNQTATISAGLAGTSGLTKTGTGYLVLSGANNYTGTTTVSAGRLLFTNPAALYGGDSLQWTPANIVVNSGATLGTRLGGASDFTDAELAGLFTNLSTVDSNGLKAGSLIGIDTGNATATVTWSHVIANSSGTGGGAVGFTKIGNGTLVLDQTNTYTGSTVVAGGILRAERGVSVPTTGNLSVSGGVLEIPQGFTDAVGAGAGQVQLGLGAGLTSGFSAYGAAPVTVTLNGNLTWSGAGAILVLNPSSANQELTLAGTGTLSSAVRCYANVNSSAAAKITKSLSTGGNNVVFGKTGTGNLVIQGGWTVTGSCHPTIYGGTLTIDNCALSVVSTENINIGRHDTAWGTTGGTFVVKPGATVSAKALYLCYTDPPVPGTVYLDGGVTTVSQVYRSLSSTGTAKIYFNGGTLKAADAANAANFIHSNLTNAYIQAGGAIIDDGGFAGITVAEPLLTDPASSGGGLTKKGAGSLILAAANTYTGTTDAQNGTLQLTGLLDPATTVNLGNASDSAKVMLGGTAGPANQTVAGLTTTGTGTANAIVGGNAAVSTLTAAIASGSSTFAGALGGAAANENNLALTKSGGGTLAITGVNSYTGATTVAGGTLALSGSLASAAITIQSGAVLDVSAVSGGWTLGTGQTLSGTGTLRSNATIGGVVLPGSPGGTLTAEHAVTFASGSSLKIDLNPNGTPQVETATAVGNVDADGGVLEVTVSGVDIPDTNPSEFVIGETVPVTLTADYTPSQWAAEVRAALALNPVISALYTVGGSGPDITLTRIVPTTYDPTLNIEIYPSAPDPGITPALVSANTSTGGPGSTNSLTTFALLDISGAKLDLNVSGTLTAPAYVIASYGSLTGAFTGIIGTGIPSGYILDYAYGGNQIAIKQSVGGNTYADWLATYPPVTGFTTDYDNDGIPNGVENILGTSPKASTAGLTQVAATTTTATFQHTLNPNIASDVTRSYQWSTDLVEWKTSGQQNSGGTTATIAPSAPVAGVVTVTVTITDGLSARLFSRLVATQSP